MEIKNIEILLIEGSDIKKTKNLCSGIVPEEIISMTVPINPLKVMFENMMDKNKLHLLTETSNIYCYKISEPQIIRKYSIHMTKVDYSKL